MRSILKAGAAVVPLLVLAAACTSPAQQAVPSASASAVMPAQQAADLYLSAVCAANPEAVRLRELMLQIPATTDPVTLTEQIRQQAPRAAAAASSLAQTLGHPPGAWPADVAEQIDHLITVQLSAAAHAQALETMTWPQLRQAQANFYSQPLDFRMGNDIRARLGLPQAGPSGSGGTGCEQASGSPPASAGSGSPGASAPASPQASVAPSDYTETYAAAVVREYLAAVAAKDVTTLCALDASRAPGNQAQVSQAECVSSYQNLIDGKKGSSDFRLYCWESAAELDKCAGMVPVRADRNKARNFVFDSARDGFRYTAGVPAGCGRYTTGCWFEVIYDKGAVSVDANWGEPTYQ